MRFPRLAWILVFFGTWTACYTAPKIEGTILYPAAVALPPGAVLEIRLEDVSRADAPSDLVSAKLIDNPGPSPISYELIYGAGRIEPQRRFAVRATIKDGERLLFVTDTRHSVLTQGHSNRADLSLVAVPEK